MRKALFALPLLVALLYAPSLHAVVFNLDPVTDPLGDCSGAVTADECMSASTTSALICSDSWGCPMCGMNATLTNSLCYRIFGNYGFCSCTANGTYYDKYGNLKPNCITKGSCTTR